MSTSSDAVEAPRSGIVKGADWTLTILLVVGQGLLSFVVGGMSLLSVMIIDGCGMNGDDPLICSGGGQLMFIAGIGAEWLFLLGGVVFSIVMASRAAARGRAAWPWPFAGLGIGVLGVGVLALTIFLTTR